MVDYDCSDSNSDCENGVCTVDNGSDVARPSRIYHLLSGRNF